LRAEAARLKTDLEARAHPTWVQAVVVIWAEFPQRVVEGDRIVLSTAMSWLPGCTGVRRRGAKSGRRSWLMPCAP
jgi:hypothetical protein